MRELVFITSNNEKLEHARYLCRHYNVLISKQKHYGIGYKEPRIFDREKLLEQSIDDALNRWRKNISNPDEKFFFIEDTSVIIPALSPGEREYPGVDVKYWMQKNDFFSVDEKLKKVDNDRRAIVRSDLILILSTKLQRKTNEKFKKFTSWVKGRIVDKEVKIQTQPLYPWLNDKTFNKWFVPDGCASPLSTLPIEIAEQHDFRKDAFKEMLLFLEKNSIITKRSFKKNSVEQRSFKFHPLLYIVCGPTCAGKTTLATFLSENYNYYHVEASDYMHLSYYQHHGVGSSVKISDFAELALKRNPSIVVNQIIRDIKEFYEQPMVITGFRSPDEIEVFKQQYQGDFNLEVVFIDAQQNIRYARCLLRERDDTHKCRSYFDLADRQQDKMGLAKIRNKFSFNIIHNNNDKESYYKEFVERYSEQLKRLADYPKQNSKDLKIPRRLEDLIILALAERFESREYFTTTEITHLINLYFTHLEKPKNKNNVSRYFNKDFHPYYEICIKGDKRCYRLSQTGLGRANWFLRNIRLQQLNAAKFVSSKNANSSERGLNNREQRGQFKAF